MTPDNLLVLVPVAEKYHDTLRSSFSSVHFADLDDEIAPEVLSQTSALLVQGIPEKLTIDQVPSLRWVQLYSAGAEQWYSSNLCKSLPKNSDIIVTSASGVHVCSISQHILLLTLSLHHRLQDLILSSRLDHKWLNKRQLFPRPQEWGYIPELKDLRIGILGYGAIGRETARIFHAFGSEIYACNSTGSAKPDTAYRIDKTGDPDGSLPTRYFSSADPESYYEFLEGVDVLVVAAPSSPATRHIVSKKALEKLPKHAVVVNIARGDLMDQEALVEALESGTIAGAGLDVTTPEPLPDGHELFKLPNVIITPHVSGATINYDKHVVDLLKTNLARINKGEEPFSKQKTLP